MVEQVSTETVNSEQSVGFDAISNGMLHEGVCHQNEVGGQPASHRDR